MRGKTRGKRDFARQFIKYLEIVSKIFLVKIAEALSLNYSRKHVLLIYDIIIDSRLQANKFSEIAGWRAKQFSLVTVFSLLFLARFLAEIAKTRAISMRWRNQWSGYRTKTENYGPFVLDSDYKSFLTHTGEERPERRADALFGEAGGSRFRVIRWKKNEARG